MRCNYLHVCHRLAILLFIYYLTVIIMGVRRTAWLNGSAISGSTHPPSIVRPCPPPPPPATNHQRLTIIPDFNDYTAFITQSRAYSFPLSSFAATGSDRRHRLRSCAT